MNALGEYLRHLRQSMGWSLRDVAEHTRISHSAISLIERGETDPRLSTLCQIAAAFGMGVGDLLTDAGHTTRTNEDGALANMPIQTRSVTFRLQYVGQGEPVISGVECTEDSHGG